MLVRILSFAAIMGFVLAVLLYAGVLFRQKKPLSYFDIRDKAKSGFGLERILWWVWNTSIFCALVLLSVSLFKIF